MDQRLKQVRELLKERGRKATIEYLNNLSDDNQIEQLEKAINIWRNAPDLKPNDLQKLIKRFTDFRKRATKNQNKLKEDLQIVLEEAKEYDQTGINPHSKESKYGGLDLNKGRQGLILPDWAIKEMANRQTKEGIIHEDNSLLGLLIDLNKKCSQLDTIIGGLNEWPHRCSKIDWEDRITKLKALKEIYPIRENISIILNGKPQKNQSGYNQYREWMEETFKILKDGSYPDDEELQKESIRKEIKNVDGRGLSAHRTTKRLKILFWHKFEREISIPQIKGMVIYENR